jgi:peptidoglycan hydrolase-like protein with peptidoglycan-binding domain
MGRARRAWVGATVGVAALGVAGAATYAVLALSATTDTALRERAATGSPTAPARPQVAATPTAEPSSPAPETGPEPAAEPAAVLDRGDQGVAVRELQVRLAQLDWFALPATGGYAATTAAAVEGFQGKRGLETTGTVDRRTWRRLLSMTRTPSQDELFDRAGPPLLQAGDDGPQVRELQARLRQVAWFSGDVSDHYGDQTTEAVRGFQGKRQVPATGRVDRRTLDLLEAMTREPTEDELANVAPDPADGAPLDPRCTTGRALCIDKTSSSLRWVVDGTVQSTLDVRFGAEYTPTREGLFTVYWKDRDHVSDLYGSAMPYAMFFSRGQAVHYSSDFAARGYAGASHGCVNVRDHTALAALFGQVRTGDRVVVYRS